MHDQIYTHMKLDQMTFDDPKVSFKRMKTTARHD